MTDKNHFPAAITHKPTALVAGGAGFIGSYLCQSLLLQGCRVLALDNLITGKEENLRDCLSNPDFKFLKHNLTRPLKEIERVDYIFHLAGMEGNKKSPHKLRVEISWKYIRRNAPYKVISLLSSVVKDIISRSS